MIVVQRDMKDLGKSDQVVQLEIALYQIRVQMQYPQTVHLLQTAGRGDRLQLVIA